jgi:hypothetical protein
MLRRKATGRVVVVVREVILIGIAAVAFFTKDSPLQLSCHRGSEQRLPSLLL